MNIEKEKCKTFAGREITPETRTERQMDMIGRDKTVDPFGEKLKQRYIP